MALDITGLTGSTTSDIACPISLRFSAVVVPEAPVRANNLASAAAISFNLSPITLNLPISCSACALA